MPKPTVTAIPEERVAAILTRAAELDRDRRETITVDALRAAALDAGISRAAVDAALEEYVAGAALGTNAAGAERTHGPPLARVRRFFRKAAASFGTPLKLAGLMFVVGLTGAADESLVVIGWCVWILMAGRLVLKHRPARRIAPYVLSLIPMTLGLMLGLAAAEVYEDAIIALIPVGAALLVAGSVLIKVRLPRRWLPRRWRRRAEPEPSAG